MLKGKPNANSARSKRASAKDKRKNSRKWNKTKKKGEQEEAEDKNGVSRGYKLISLKRKTKLRARHERKARKMRVAFFKRDFKINGHQARKSI